MYLLSQTVLNTEAFTDQLINVYYVNVERMKKGIKNFTAYN